MESIEGNKIELTTGIIVGNNITEEDVKRVTGNREIALFMGADVDENQAQVIDHWKDDTGKIISKYVMGKYYFPSDKPDTYDKVVRLWDMQYHASWDWLMPVVEKIGEICKENEDAATNKDSWAIDGWKTWSEQVCRFNCNLTKIKIEYTWKTVIQFIQWYSLNKNKNV